MSKSTKGGASAGTSKAKAEVKTPPAPGDETKQPTAPEVSTDAEVVVNTTATDADSADSSTDTASSTDEPTGSDGSGSDTVVEHNAPETAVVWPQEYSLTNNTRSLLSLPAQSIEVPPFGGVATFKVRNEGFLLSLEADLRVLAHLNGLSEGCYVLKKATTAEE